MFLPRLEVSRMSKLKLICLFCMLALAALTAPASALYRPGWIVRVYPNPVSQSLHLDVISMGVPAVLEVFNVRGDLVRNRQYGVLPLGPLSLDLDVRGLASSIYYVRYRDSKGTLSTGVTRIVVMR
jgi:hypothetical protein